MILTIMPSFLSRIFDIHKIPLLITSLFLLVGGCTSQEASTSIKPLVETWYKTYQERSDFKKFLALYDEEMILEDIILGEKKVGKTDFAAFFDWENPGFSKTDTSTLIITSSVIEGREAILKGYFTAFNWGDVTYEAMHFTTLLSFNDAGKITKQVDWINYPDELIDYSSRKNSNEWINQ